MIRLTIILFPLWTHFGRWSITDDWSPLSKRGPSIISEYEAFRGHVLSLLDKSVFDKPICEVMLDQRYFSSVGNYLRAEILYRLDINPYLCARSVLENLPAECDPKKRDILKLCHDICWEVIDLKGSGKPYDPDQIYGDHDVFEEWLQCYMHPSMGNTVDDKGRTMWHSNKYGKGKQTRHVVKKKRLKEDVDRSSVPKTTSRSKRGSKKIKSQSISQVSNIEEEAMDFKGGIIKSEPLECAPETESVYFRRSSARLRAAEGKEDKSASLDPLSQKVDNEPILKKE